MDYIQRWTVEGIHIKPYDEWWEGPAIKFPSKQIEITPILYPCESKITNYKQIGLLHDRCWSRSPRSFNLDFNRWIIFLIHWRYVPYALNSANVTCVTWWYKWRQNQTVTYFLSILARNYKSGTYRQWVGNITYRLKSKLKLRGELDQDPSRSNPIC